MKVVHLTSVHPRYDTRIFVKECQSLAETFDVVLIVADGKGDEYKEGIRILDVGKPRNRRERVLQTTRRILERAKAINADLYHFHDPELLWVGLRLKKMGKTVVFDAHEDVPRQILAKTYIPTWLRKSASWIVEHFENFIVRRLDAVVAPTPLIAERFRAVGTQAVEVRNFPICEEVGNQTPWEQREDSVCYIGAISRTRGIEEMVRAMEFCPVQFELGGDFRPASLQQEIEMLPGWNQVRRHGFLHRPQVQAILAKSKIGLVTLHPTDSYLEAIPVKMFEYMAAGIPFIASDFPFWRRILKGYECGLFVDPLDPKAIGDAICRLMNDQTLARQMGQNGRDAAKTTFRWEHEADKLQQLYADLLKDIP
jgi:glycosyltransferase involved in cell wall biosynthesis